MAKKAAPQKSVARLRPPQRDAGRKLNAAAHDAPPEAAHSSSTTTTTGSALDAPPFRRLRVYSFDPSLDTQLDTAVVNRATVQVPWEQLAPGPVGEYVEVVDFDPASHCFYAPVDLNHPFLLAEDGLEPSEGCPQFHQQMVYAVAMTTIHNFERALGRTALWATQITKSKSGAEEETYVQRLRLYPHALRVANAYYTPQKKALLFGYFPATASNPGQHMPRGIVFTCLSHDIIAHETTHALLDGMNRRYLEPTNPDVLAFHEAFADIVALFQHFSMPEVLRHQISRTRGDLANQNLLGQLAQQFGETTGRYGALRDALGKVDPATGKWEPSQPDPSELDRVFTPHERGSILVAAVFDAFLSIYKSRIADLLRIATSGTGILPSGALHPDLINRLALEAARSAQHVLNMCIRALDYCPPVDLTFGEYFRALITADYDLVRDDDRHYRTAFIEAFRRRGIYPRDVRTLSVDSLRWDLPAALLPAAAMFPPFSESLLALVRKWDISSDRRVIFEQLSEIRLKLQKWLAEVLTPEVGRKLGLDIQAASASRRRAAPDFEVTALRPARRIGPDGQHLLDLVIEITQKRWVAAQPPAPDATQPAPELPTPENTPRGFWFYGGCNVVYDLQQLGVRYCIIKDLASTTRLARQQEFWTRGSLPSLQATYFGRLEHAGGGEVFAFLHATGEEEDS